jgi:hypothetical protein
MARPIRNMLTKLKNFISKCISSLIFQRTHSKLTCLAYKSATEPSAQISKETLLSDQLVKKSISYELLLIKVEAFLVLSYKFFILLLA